MQFKILSSYPKLFGSLDVTTKTTILKTGMIRRKYSDQQPFYSPGKF